MIHVSRRSFLTGSAASFLGGTGLLAGLGAGRAHASDVTGYRALVCLFFFGGLDHADTVFPFDQGEFDQLAAARNGLFGAYSGDPFFARTRNNLLELDVRNAANFGGRSFALAPGMEDLQALFASGELAIVGNVGPLIEPTDRASFVNETVDLPPRLFSHNDQQSTWMALGVEGAQLGWGGRFADATLASDPNADPLFSAITTAGNQVYLSGQTARQFAAGSSTGSAIDLNITSINFFLGPGTRGVEQRAAVEAFYAQNNFGNSSILERDYARISSTGIGNVRSFNQATNNIVPFATEFPQSPLGRQLQTVAETIEARNEFDVSRQIFFVGLGGFDTHSAQSSELPQRQVQMSAAIGAFRNAMVERGIWQDVTLFTASDFGRALVDNGDGTDHGWGGHHFVAGGSVNGGQIFGEIPLPDTSLPQYTPISGRLIPNISVEQYAATLGAWFGLNGSELQAALPNLNRFSNTTVGFI
ncbi:MAG: DUF1501 domain-containing protein [Pseudomonadota bacterium]